MTVNRERGSILIAVLWLAAVLTAVAFALAASVRTEIDRAGADANGTRAYYLATGSVERALLWLRWAPTYRRPDGGPLFFDPRSPRMTFTYPTGQALVELIPESSKFNINLIKPEDLFHLLMALGVVDAPAHDLTDAILDWRTAASSATGSPFDAFYLSRTPSFQSPHASITELEDLLLVKGMTAELFYGSWTRDAEGRAVWHAGLRDCLTAATQNDGGGFDANTVQPAVLRTLGAPPEAIDQIVARRRDHPFETVEEINTLLPPEVAGRLRLGGGSVLTLRSTARALLPNGQPSTLRRAVAALVKLREPGQDPELTVLRWYNNVQPGPR